MIKGVAPGFTSMSGRMGVFSFETCLSIFEYRMTELGFEIVGRNGTQKLKLPDTFSSGPLSLISAFNNSQQSESVMYQ